jgi:hypothetical protein
MHLMATLCVASSLTLFPLGRSDQTWQVSPKNPELLQAQDNHVPHFGYGCHIPQCRGHVVRGVGVACKLMFTVPFYHACKGPLLCLLSCHIIGL